MVRAVLAVIASYIVMFLLLFACFTAAYLLLGVNHAFRPASYDVSHRWLALMFAVHFVAAAIAGLVCAAIAKGGKAPLALAVVVLVMGILFAIPVLTAQRTAASMVRTGDVPNIEAMQRARMPPWAALLTPVVGVVGVLIGARLKRRS